VGSIPDGVIGILILSAHYGPGVDSDFNKIECQEYILGGEGV